MGKIFTKAGIDIVENTPGKRMKGNVTNWLTFMNKFSIKGFCQLKIFPEKLDV